MEVIVPVTCTDKLIEVNLTALLKIEYFKLLLSNFNTKVVFDKQVITENGMLFTVYNYKIPHVTVDCDSDLFVKLVNLSGTTIKIKFDEYNKEELLKLMLYIDMYQIDCKLTHYIYKCRYSNSRFSDSDDDDKFKARCHFDFVQFVKHNMPHLNAFEVIRKGKFIWANHFIHHGSKLFRANQLSNDLCEDLFELVCAKRLSKCSLELMSAFYNIPYYYKKYPSETKLMFPVTVLQEMVINCRLNTWFRDEAKLKEYVTKFQTIGLINEVEKIECLKIAN